MILLECDGTTFIHNGTNTEYDDMTHVYDGLTLRVGSNARSSFPRVVLKDRTILLTDHAVVLKDRTVVLKNRTILLWDRTVVLRQETKIFMNSRLNFVYLS